MAALLRRLGGPISMVQRAQAGRLRPRFIHAKEGAAAEDSTSEIVRAAEKLYDDAILIRQMLKEQRPGAAQEIMMDEIVRRTGRIYGAIAARQALKGRVVSPRDGFQWHRDIPFAGIAGTAIGAYTMYVLFAVMASPYHDLRKDKDRLLEVEERAQTDKSKPEEE